MALTEQETREEVNRLFKEVGPKDAYEFYVNSGHAVKPIMTFAEFKKGMSQPYRQERVITIYFVIMFALCLWAISQL